MSFYKNIADYYDDIFPLNMDQVDFIESKFRVLEGKKILDLGCGTGSLNIMLGRRGAAVRGLDLNERMIVQAKKKKPQAINVQFVQGNMLDLNSFLPGVNFDVICSFGNTLVHLKNKNEIEKVISLVSSKLKSSGTFMVQIINYDRIIAQSIEELPLIENSNVRFQRIYHKKKNKTLEFTSLITLKESQEEFKQSASLFALTKNELEDILGLYFKDIKWWGSFKREEWTDNSFHTIVEAKI